MGLGDIGKALEKMDEGFASMTEMKEVLGRIEALLTKIEENTRPNYPTA